MSMPSSRPVQPQSPPARPARKPISRAQIEIVASRAVAFFGVAFGAQTVPVALEQRELMRSEWFLVVAIAIFSGLFAAAVASVVKKFVKPTSFFVMGVFLIAIVSWPLGIGDAVWPTMDRPWLWFLITVATAAAAIVLPTWIATVYLLLVPILYGIIRVTPSGGSANLGFAILDVVYAIILGGAVLIILTMLRGAAASVDSVQSTALARYVNAVREHAMEVERVHVDSIVHDSVLTTLLSTARADTAQAKELATTMARSAIGHLQAETATVTENARDVSVSSVFMRISMAAGTLSSDIDVRRGPINVGMVPATVGEALYAATLQALLNSLQHAGDRDDIVHWVSADVIQSGAILVEVGDTGNGFDISDVPTARLGLRVSIIERIANVGGHVDVDSVPGEGTAIRIRWPAPRTDRSLPSEEQS